MKIFHRKPSANFPQTPVWGITATKYAVVIALGLHDVLIELPQRKLTKRPPDVCNASDCQEPAVCAGLCEKHSF